MRCEKTALKQNINTIENVYQSKYNNNIVASGLGDFIRGSYFLMQFCKKYNIFYNINLLNHPINQFLDIYKNQQSLSNYNNINKFLKINYNPFISHHNIITNISDNTINYDFIYFLNGQPITNNNTYVYTISYPTTTIDQEHKDIMKNILKPTDEICLLVEKKINNLNLTKNNFTIIHIRYGDDYLIKNDKTIDMVKIQKIILDLKKCDKSKYYLLISDNNFIKNIIIKHYPFIKTDFNEITHTGENVNIDINKLQNTMIDFFLFSYAKKIIAFSVYKHGTGFSKWSAETYNIPYICKFLE